MPLTFRASLSHSMGLPRRMATMPTMAISATQAAVSKPWKVLPSPLQASSHSPHVVLGPRQGHGDRLAGLVVLDAAALLVALELDHAADAPGVGEENALLAGEQHAVARHLAVGREQLLAQFLRRTGLAAVVPPDGHRVEAFPGGEVPAEVAWPRDSCP